MSIDEVKGIANAVLYEGYIFYPYRPSSIKNRQRWTFGGVFPRAFAGRQGDCCFMRTEALLRSAVGARLAVHVRFLQVIERAVGKLADPVVAWQEACEPKMTFVSRLEVAGREVTAWDEAVEREITLEDLDIDDVAKAPRRMPFSFPDLREMEAVRDADALVVAALVRKGKALEGVIEVLRTGSTRTSCA